MNKLDGIIKSQKDVLSHGCKKNVVYKICCKSCNASYVEQKERKLKARIAEHRNKINSKFGNPSSRNTEENLDMTSIGRAQKSWITKDI